MSRAVLAPFEQYQKARVTFASFYDALEGYMRSHTSGFWGDYSFKLVLDVACNMSLPPTTPCVSMESFRAGPSDVLHTRQRSGSC